MAGMSKARGVDRVTKSSGAASRFGLRFGVVNESVFGGCFGWLHPGEGKRGVVLCNAFGHKSVRSHKGIRRVAESLSARGIVALRFDYLGTGDSVGADGASDQLETCLADVCAATAWLARETGVTHVTLCGLRLGAAFALLAARRLPVDQLVLLAPVVSGRSYVRELSIIRKTWLEQLPAPVRASQKEDAPLNVLGQTYSKQFQADLTALDPARELRDASVKPVSRALIFDIRPNASESLREQKCKDEVAIWKSALKDDAELASPELAG